MYIKQVSVFLENEAGRLRTSLQLLGDNGVDICALSLADTTDFGVLRLITQDADRAVKLLREAHITASVTEVIGVGMSNTPGSLAAVLGILAEAHIGVEYAYAFIGQTAFPACVIMRATDNEAAVRVLSDHAVPLLNNVEKGGAMPCSR